MAEIDVLFQGTPGAICCHRVDGAIVDPGPGSTVATLLERLGGEVPERIVLTHIHLDHAGATGLLVREWPGVEVWVHARGAPHLVDPSRLIASAARIYGDRMGPLWGEIVPVPEGNLRVLSGDGGSLGGGWDFAYTPGHASHHVTYFHDGVAYVGDVAGVRIGDGPILAPTPPPDIDVEAWHGSIDAVERRRPRAIALTHFGMRTDVAEHLAALREALDRWAQRARVQDAEAFERGVREELAGIAEEDAYLEAMPPDTLYAGLARYWRRRNNEGA